MLHQPAQLATVGQAGPLHPPGPPPILALQGCLEPRSLPPSSPPCRLSLSGHCHFSSRLRARPHLHYSPDGSPQPRFPELPATPVSVPGRRKGHGCMHSGRFRANRDYSHPSSGQSRAGWFGVRGDSWLDANAPPFLPPTPNLEQMWILLRAGGRNFSPLPDTRHTLCTLQALLESPSHPLPPTPYPLPPLWVEDWSPRAGV